MTNKPVKRIKHSNKKIQSLNFHVSKFDNFKNEQKIAVEGANLKIKHTPGHTTDHVCLVLEDENTLFSGDCILGETSAVFEDLHDYMLSLEMILGENSSLIYPGHGPLVNDPNSKIKAYIEHRRKREEQIVAFLENKSSKGPSDVMEIVESMYKVG